MNQLNSIILEGNLVKDVVLSEPCEGFKKASFSVAVNRWYKNSKGEGCTEVSYFDVEAYGRIAEYSVTKAVKGRGVRVVGRLKQDSWKDSEGKYHSKTYVIAELIEYRPITYAAKEIDVTKVAEKINSVMEPPVAGVEHITEKQMEAVAF